MVRDKCRLLWKPIQPKPHSWSTHSKASWKGLGTWALLCFLRSGSGLYEAREQETVGGGFVYACTCNYISLQKRPCTCNYIFYNMLTTRLMRCPWVSWGGLWCSPRLGYMQENSSFVCMLVWMDGWLYLRRFLRFLVIWKDLTKQALSSACILWEAAGTRKLLILVCFGKLPMYFTCVDILWCPLGELTLIVQVVSMSDLSSHLNVLLKSVNLADVQLQGDLTNLIHYLDVLAILCFRFFF